MAPHNRNLFPIVSVLATASIIAGFCGIVFVAADRLGGEPRTILSLGGQAAGGQQLEGDRSSLATSGSSTSDTRFSSMLGNHDATVLSVDVLDVEEEFAREAGLGRSLIASGSYDNTVKVWSSVSTESSAGTRAKVLSLVHNGRVNDLAFIPNVKSPAQSAAASRAGGDTEDAAGSAANRLTEERASEQRPVKRLVTGSGSGEIKLWNLATGDTITTIADKAGRIMSLAVDASSAYIASGSSDGAIKIWPIEEISLQKSQTNLRGKTLTAVGPQINTLAFHPTNSNLLVSGDQEGTIQVWDLQQNKPTLTLVSGADRIVSLSISQDGQYVASGSYDKLIRIWNLETGKPVQTLAGHDFVVADVTFSPDGKLLASGSYDESVRTWDWAQGEELCKFRGHSGFVYAVAFANGGSTLVSGGYDGTVRAWDLADPERQGCL